MNAIRPPIISIIEQHVEDAAFCWARREEGLTSPNHNYQHIARIDSRLDAHLEGMCLAQEIAWPHALKRLQKWKCADDAFAAAYLAFQQPTEEKLAELESALLKTPLIISGISSALLLVHQIHSNNYSGSIIEHWLARNNPLLVRALLPSILFEHHKDSEKLLLQCLQSENELLRADALLAIGEQQLKKLLPNLKNSLMDSSPLCRIAASSSCALLGHSEFQQQNLSNYNLLNASSRQYHLLIWSITSSNEEFTLWFNDQLQIAHSLRELIWVQAFRGDGASLIWLSQCLDIPNYEILAAYAIQHITGLNLDTLTETIETYNTDAEDETIDDIEYKNIKADSEGLTQPNTAELKTWLIEHQHIFPAGKRFLNGQDISSKHIELSLLCTLPQHRHLAALNTMMGRGNQLSNFSTPLIF